MILNLLILNHNIHLHIFANFDQIVVEHPTDYFSSTCSITCYPTPTVLKCTPSSSFLFISDIFIAPLQGGPEHSIDIVGVMGGDLAPSLGGRDQNFTVQLFE